jgi:UDP-N-acetylglucosamine 2-epimerase
VSPATRAAAPLKVLTIVGTRPEIIKLSRVIAELDRTTRHVLVHTGQNFDYELNEVFFKELEIRRPDHFLAAAADTPMETIANVIARADKVLASEKPDAVLLYGDTNSCLAVIAARRRQIPVFHMEAGNRCFDARVPEEMNRKLVDHLSDVNLPLTEHARRYLLAEGLRPELVIKTGSTMPEVLEYYAPGIASSDVLKRMSLAPREYVVVSAHREENVDTPAQLTELTRAIAEVGRVFGKRVVFSVHPRTRARLEAGALTGTGGVEFLKPMGFLDYVRLEKDAFCVLSDSGTLTEEAALLGFPAVMLRQAHERPEGMDAGVAVLAGWETQRILQAVTLVTEQQARDAQRDTVPDYASKHVSRQVARVILSYVDYVNRVVWQKTPPR